MSKYYEKFHNTVGNLPVTEVFTLLYMTDPQGNLMLQREAGGIYWKLPGSFLEPGQSVTESMKRAILETFGVLIEEASLIRVFSGSDQFYVSEDSIKTYPLYFVFLPQTVHGSLSSPPKDGSEIRFFAPWNIPIKRIFPPQKTAVNYFIDHCEDGSFTQPYSNKTPPIC